MRDWDAIIDAHEKEGFITAAEAKELRGVYEHVKTAGPWSAIKNFGGKVMGKAETGMKGLAKDLNPGKLLIAGLGLTLMEQGIEAGIDRMKSGKEYERMLEILKRDAPEILDQYSEDEIRDAFSMVKTYAPIMSQNPSSAAVAVRDSLGLRSEYGINRLQQLATLQKTVTDARPRAHRRLGSENLSGSIDYAKKFEQRTSKILQPFKEKKQDEQTDKK